MYIYIYISYLPLSLSIYIYIYLTYIIITIMVITINITTLILSEQPSTLFNYGFWSPRFVDGLFDCSLFASEIFWRFIWKWGIRYTQLPSCFKIRLGKWWNMMENDGKWWKMMENDGKWKMFNQLESWRCFSMFHILFHWIWSLSHWTPIWKTVSNGIFRHAPRWPGSDFSTRSPDPTPVAMSEVVRRRYICVGSMGVYYVDKINR